MLSSSKYKFIKFPLEEYIERFGAQPEGFVSAEVIRYALGGFCGLLAASEVSTDSSFKPSWEFPEACFIYALSDFELTYLESLSLDKRAKKLENKHFELDFALVKSGISGAKAIIDFKTSVENDFRNTKCSVEIKLELKDKIAFSALLYNSLEEFNKAFDERIKELYEAIEDKLSPLLKYQAPQVRKTLYRLPDYLKFATAPVVQELRRTLSINKDSMLASPAQEGLFINNKTGNYNFTPVQALAKMSDTMEKMSDLTVDVLNGIIHIWLEKAENIDQPVLICADDLLFLRGKRANISQSGRRGGYKEIQRKEIEKQLEILAAINIKVSDMLLPQLDSIGNRKYGKWSGESPVIYYSKWKEDRDYYYLVQPAEVLRLTLIGAGRKTGLIHRKIAEYDPVKYLFEKRIGNYLAWIWRNRVLKGDYLSPLSVESLLKEVKKNLNVRRPADLRTRLEEALDKLLSDGVIRSWQYEYINEDELMIKNWLALWLKYRLIIEPPMEIIREYSAIGRQNKHSPHYDRNDLNIIFEKSPLSQTELSESTGIIPSALSKILSGRLKPDSRELRKIKKGINKS